MGDYSEEYKSLYSESARELTKLRAENEKINDNVVYLVNSRANIINENKQLKQRIKRWRRILILSRVLVKAMGDYNLADEITNELKEPK